MREPTDREAAVLDQLTARIRPTLTPHFRLDSCIVATRVGLDVLAAFGISAAAVPVSVIALNPAAWAMAKAGADLDQIGAASREPAQPGHPHPWTVGVGLGGGKPGTWPGHVVVGLKHSAVVADLSIDQATRPAHDIELVPYWTRIADAAWWGPHRSTHGPWAMLEAPAGAALMMRQSAGSRGFQESPNWRRRTGQDTELIPALTGRLVREIRAAL